MIDYLRLVFLVFVIVHALEAFVRDLKARGGVREPAQEAAFRAKAVLAVTVWIVIQASPVLYYGVELLKSLVLGA